MSDEQKKVLKSWGIALAFAGILALRLWSRIDRGGERTFTAPDSPLMPYWPAFAAGAFLIPVLLVAPTAFTFDFSKPVMLWLRMRVRVGFMLWVLCATAVFVLFGDRLRLPQPALIALGIVLLVIAAVTLPARIEAKALRERLRARGEALPGLEPVSLQQRSGTQWEQVEAGLLFREGSELRFVGDRLDVRIDPASLRREVLPGTLAGMFGKKGLVLTLRLPEGSVEQVRVAPHGAWNPLRVEDDAEQLARRLAS